MNIQILEIPPRRAIAIDGTGKPGGEEFEAAVGALYAVAYPLRFALKARDVDRKVAHLEALWDLEWHWKLFLPLPEEATEAEIAAAKEHAARKHPAVERIGVETVEEGTVIEATHIGPYSTEAETVAAMDDYAADLGFSPSGPHHEIYLSDPTRTKPEKLRTVLRHPVTAASI